MLFNLEVCSDEHLLTDNILIKLILLFCVDEKKFFFGNYILSVFGSCLASLDMLIKSKDWAE